MGSNYAVTFFDVWSNTAFTNIQLEFVKTLDHEFDNIVNYLLLNIFRHRPHTPTGTLIVRRSLIKIMNDIGPKLEPCGIPDMYR